jgi:hypothetical protein
MAKMGKFDYSELKKLQKQLQKLQNPEAFVESLAKEIAKRLYDQVKDNTPIGVYPESSGKVGGTLKHGWKIGKIEKTGGTYVIDIINPVEYASYVEYGHRTVKVDGYGWCPGIHFVEKSVNNVDRMSKPLLEKRMNDYLSEMFKG